MNLRIVVTGTDTGIGKTVFSAALAGALNAFYWKPAQASFQASMAPFAKPTLRENELNSMTCEVRAACTFAVNACRSRCLRHS